MVTHTQTHAVLYLLHEHTHVCVHTDTHNSLSSPSPYTHQSHSMIFPVHSTISEQHSSLSTCFVFYFPFSVLYWDSLLKSSHFQKCHYWGLLPCIHPQVLWFECIANAIVVWRQKRRRIYYACMGKIVNRVTQLHLKHAYFPRIDSQIDLLKKYCSVKTMNVGFGESQNSERQRACDRKRQTLQN